ncbi:MAG: TRASH domain-containing protein [Candidatus Latescibacteria bacterium]|nr:TRASH domain-containing protein [Candidatus Latescibacterota bacterium]NIO01038.1 TRASH domain-containing protein [Candidatus Latescibacterota bacterium]NIO27437.1 TRASH domain-containing protein [Candidatus Latescibacterota bacterium]NIO54959.1 TRASH domain-containing protein [Candidatus Latescibacterota bacterium]NIT01048.1 TRASH domain-containing protein [Candidatus Latescibacterota bacterium]
METCAYCGDEIVDGGVTLDEHVFCCQECLEAFREESYEFLENEEFDSDDFNY